VLYDMKDNKLNSDFKSAYNLKKETNSF